MACYKLIRRKKVPNENNVDNRPTFISIFVGFARCLGQLWSFHCSPTKSNVRLIILEFMLALSPTDIRGI